VQQRRPEGAGGDENQPQIKVWVHKMGSVSTKNIKKYQITTFKYGRITKKRELLKTQPVVFHARKKNTPKK
jgi:hypothetical protein